MDSVIGLDADRRCVALESGTQINYDFLSLSTGGETDLSCLDTAGDRVLAVRPLDLFVRRWPHILSAVKQKPDYRLIVVGGGAAGIELAFAARHAFDRLGG